jgi:outer membrane protein assembly factor BamB/predicted phosphodiesterase
MMTKKTILLLIIILFLPGTIAAANFSFALITDLHVGNPGNDEDLRLTVKDINSLDNIDFVIASGDITEFGSLTELQTAKSILNQLNKPWYAIPGNHDSNWSESGNNDFLKIFGSETFGFEHKGYLFAGMASGPNMRMGPGQIPRENLTWFMQLLSKTDKSKPMIVVNHYPMDNGLNNWYQVMDALRPYNVQLMLCGHGHANRKLSFEGANAAMCRANIRAKQPSAGYNIISIISDSIYLQERLASGVTQPAWLTYPANKRPEWDTNPARPDYSINANHSFVKEVWSKQEDSDIGGGMYLHKQQLIITNTSGEVKALSAKDGSMQWSYKTGGKIYSTPLVVQNTVWVASTDSYLYGLSSTNGKMKHKLSNNKAVVASPATDGKRIMLAGGDGHCRAWNQRTGKQLWQYDSIRNFVVTRPQVRNNTFYFGSWGNEFYAINSTTGQPRWIWKSGHSNRMLSPAQVVPVITRGRIYIVSPDRYMTVLDESTGTVQWRFNDPQHRVRESIGISQDGNTVYAKTMDGNIIALDATFPTRQIKWISHGESMGYELAPTPVVEYNGIVLSPTDKGLIYAFSAANGDFLWKYRVSSGLITMILPAGKGELYVSAMDGKVVKIRI